MRANGWLENPRTVSDFNSKLIIQQRQSKFLITSAVCGDEKMLKIPKNHKAVKRDSFILSQQIKMTKRKNSQFYDHHHHFMLHTHTPLPALEIF
jgi:hypothetical protein